MTGKVGGRIKLITLDTSAFVLHNARIDSQKSLLTANTVQKITFRGNLAMHTEIDNAVYLTNLRMLAKAPIRKTKKAWTGCFEKAAKCGGHL